MSQLFCNILNKFFNNYLVFFFLLDFWLIGMVQFVEQKFRLFLCEVGILLIRSLVIDSKFFDQWFFFVSDLESDVSDFGNSLVLVDKSFFFVEMMLWCCQQCYKIFFQCVVLQLYVCLCQFVKFYQCGQCSLVFFNFLFFCVYVILYLSEKLFKCGFCFCVFVGVIILNNYIRFYMG